MVREIREQLGQEIPPEESPKPWSVLKKIQHFIKFPLPLLFEAPSYALLLRGITKIGAYVPIPETNQVNLNSNIPDCMMTASAQILYGWINLTFPMGEFPDKVLFSMLAGGALLYLAQAACKFFDKV